MKTIGILGGVGPDTTAKIYLSVVKQIKKEKGKYPPIVIYNLPFPSSIEEDVIIKGKNVSKMLPYLIDGTKVLEKSGADFGILPCNTLHTYIEQIRAKTRIPFLSILEETVRCVIEKKMNTVGILATETTINTNIYQNAFERSDVKLVRPTVGEQRVINAIIVEILNGIKNRTQRERLFNICNALKQRGAEAILLACTDLQLILSGNYQGLLIIDTTEVLIDSSVRIILKDATTD